MKSKFELETCVEDGSYYRSGNETVIFEPSKSKEYVKITVGMVEFIIESNDLIGIMEFLKQ